MRLQGFRVTIGEICEDVPDCHKVLYLATLVNDRGFTVDRRRESIVPDSLLSDSDQVPWLIAHTLQELMVQQREDGHLG